MMEISDKLGGYPDGLSRMFDGLDAKALPCTELADMFFMGGSLKIRPRSSGKGGLAPFKMVDETVTLKKRDGTTVEINFRDGDYYIEVESSIKLRPEIECFEIACGLLVEKIQPIFK
jgi:hypothetical protein